MDQTLTNCPNSDNGIHRYFIFKVQEIYEPYYFTLTAPENIETINAIHQAPTLYERVEYAYCGCNCGSAIRSRIKHQ